MADTAITDRNRSYSVRLAHGDRIRTRRPLRAGRGDWGSDRTYVDVPAGTVLTQVGSDTNAGFRGIEFYAVYTAPDGLDYSVIGSTGCVDKVGA